MSNDVLVKYLTREEWDALAAKFRDLSYVQSASYAIAAAREIGAGCEFIGVFHCGQLLGLANVRVKLIPLIGFGIAYVHYGPLSGRSDDFLPEVFGRCLQALRKTYVEDRKLILRVVPPFGEGNT